MHSTLLNLCYLSWVLALIALSIAGTTALIVVSLNIYHRSATYAKPTAQYTRWQKWLTHMDSEIAQVPVCFFLIAIGAAVVSYGSAILHLLTGGGINAL